MLTGVSRSTACGARCAVFVVAFGVAGSLALAGGSGGGRLRGVPVAADAEAAGGAGPVKPVGFGPGDGSGEPTLCGSGGGDRLLYPYPGAIQWEESIAPNDDESSTEIALPFPFRFQDQVFASCRINNNGNVTFDGPRAQYTPDDFGGTRWMLAPFWADVDTRAAGSVSHAFVDSDGDGDLDTMVVTWDHVGYFRTHADKVNTFQLVITDGSNPLFDRCRTVAFSYGEMCWTTGDFSDGADGFGGFGAIVGADWVADGAAGVLLGTYDAPGDGAGGIDRLDGQSFVLSVAHDPYDLDGSGEIDNGDVAIVLMDMGAPGGPSDIDGNGLVDFGDVAILLLSTGPACQ